MSRRLQQTWKWLRACLVIGIIFIILLVTGILGLYFYGVAAGAPPLAVPQTSLFYGSDGSVIAESHHGENRYWVDLEDISPNVIAATISIEDKKFFRHFGFDIKRIIAAAITDLKEMAKAQGASTITQQYARNLYLDHDKSWDRKIREALLAIRLEVNYSKEEILEGYLNTIYYGHGAYGIEAAANYYFGKHAKDLNISEAAMLAGIPKAPSYYSPLRDEGRAKARQQLILQTMKNDGLLTEQQAAEAAQAPLVYAANKEISRADIAPYFIAEVKKELEETLKIPSHIIEMGGLKIYTTLDPSLQKIAEQKMQEIIADTSEIQTALVALEPATGKVKALVGGRDFAESPFNRATQALRMPGSTFKPFLYYLAIENGFTPATTMKSEPVNFIYDEGREIYRPSNFNNYYAYDFITLAQAMALSDNIYAVKTNMFLGADKLAETAKRFGISTELLPVPSLALGTSSVKVIDMVAGYGALANGGMALEPVFIERVETHNGEIIYEHEMKAKRQLDEKAAFITTHLMTGMFDAALNDYTTVTGQSIMGKLTRPYAGKSGTTKTDSWMIGYSPQLVAGVWVGYDKEKQITLVAERQYAKEYWASFMEAAHEGLPITNFKPPEGVVAKYIHPKTGLLATNACPPKRLAYFIEGTEPTEYCKAQTADEPMQEEDIQAPQDDKGWFKRFLERIF